MPSVQPPDEIPQDSGTTANMGLGPVVGVSLGESLRAGLFSLSVNGRAGVCDSRVLFCWRVGYPMSHQRTEMSAAELITVWVPFAFTQNHNSE